MKKPKIVCFFTKGGGGEAVPPESLLLGKKERKVPDLLPMEAEPGVGGRLFHQLAVE